MIRSLILPIACAAIVMFGPARAVLSSEPDDGPAEAESLSVRWRSGERAAIVVSGLSDAQLLACRRADGDAAAWRRLMTVRVGEQPDEKLPPMLGTYRVERREIVFEPRFRPRPGLTYRVTLDPNRLSGIDSDEPSEAIVRVLRVPAERDRPVARLLEVYPTTDRLPQNLLKFYFHFSEPMSRGEAYRRIRLYRSSGERVEDPFLELVEELWDPSGRRFTLLFDPGRIKRGLKPNEEVGAPLEVGETYDLVVDENWPDGHGQSLTAPLRKRFLVVAPDHDQPDPAEWRITTPRARSRDPLIVEFRESLDQAMLVRVLAVLDAKKEPLSGEITVDRNERRWQFRPEKPWAAGSYSLRIDTTLEDMAGNSVGRPFEVDLSEVDDDAPAIPPFAHRPFVVSE